MEDLQKKLDTALSRIAALESGRSAPQTGVDQAALVRAFINDPIGTMTKYGIPVDHVMKIGLAHVMGDQAPQELRSYALQREQASTTHALSSELQATRQRLEAIEARDSRQALKTSFSTLTADKTKYPLLAAAYAKNPALIDSRLDSHKGDAAAFADAIEAEFKALAPALGAPQPASTENAEQAKAQSTQGQQAQQQASGNGGSVDPTPPPITQKQPGVFTQETHEQLKDRILRKYS